MKKVYLCGHTGSTNRGCEAIVRSTAHILKLCGVQQIYLLTMDKEKDVFLGLDKVVNLIPYPEKSFFQRCFYFSARKLTGDYLYGAKKLHKKLFKNIDQNSILFSIGGDTYCSKNIPTYSFAMNIEAEKRLIPTVFWGCSVENKILTDKMFSDDVKRYTYVTPREEISKNIIRECIKDDSKILKVCDPAFHLDTKEVALPKGFSENNTVGLNLSPLILREASDESIILKNAYALIDYILESTPFNLCLIPHVYTVSQGSQDLSTLEEIYKRYKENERVSLVNEELSCTELKYIISKCRFFIGARTHSVIAAYSSSVPCLAISYSVKSIGIAKDFFGEGKYILSHKDMKTADELKNAFISLCENEDQIRKRYEEFLPAYKQTIIDATKKIISSLND